MLFARSVNTYQNLIYFVPGEGVAEELVICWSVTGVSKIHIGHCQLVGCYISDYVRIDPSKSANLVWFRQWYVGLLKKAKGIV
jgi:hypothetical protein